jgi:hypothetical protein
MFNWILLTESIGRAGLATILLWLALRLSLVPLGSASVQADSPRYYTRLIALGGCLGLTCGLDWFWFSWLFVFFIYLKRRKWLPIHKIAGHNLFWLGYLVGAGVLVGLSWLMQGSLWLRVNQFPVNVWLWFGLVAISLLFLADGLNRLRLRNPVYWQMLKPELLLVGLLLTSIFIAAYFDIFRLLTFIPVAWFLAVNRKSEIVN